MRKWFYFDNSDPNSGAVLLRSLSFEEFKNIALNTLGENDEMKILVTLSLMIVAWKDIKLDGMDIECNYVNKNKLLHIQQFVDFIGDCVEFMREYMTE